jgi:hypothetical protein
MFVLFSPHVASMGNFGMSTASTKVAQNLGLEADNVLSKPSSRPHPFQTQLGITWHATFK